MSRFYEDLEFRALRGVGFRHLELWQGVEFMDSSILQI